VVSLKTCFFLVLAGLGFHGWICAGPGPALIGEGNPLGLPSVGAHELRIISPTLLELSLVSTKPPDPAPVSQWDFVGTGFKPNLPRPGALKVLVDGREQPVAGIGFKRRALYAPLKRRDLRIGNYLYLELAREVSEGQVVEVQNPGGTLWKREELFFKARMERRRWSPVIHVNQVGYVPQFPKKAMVGHYLGSLGELKATAGKDGKMPLFRILEASSGKEVFEGRLVPRPDRGFTFPTYQQVLEADFSELRQAGEYQLEVPGFGVSFPFWIDEGVAAAFARAHALGLYHQRCGTSNTLPFTRFTRGECHAAPAEVPTPKFKGTQELIRKTTQGAKDDKRHSAPHLTGVESSLYPFVRNGKVDVSGGHHDAGDYSKYTINSAGLIHHLVFAADAFPGAGGLDNLGIPESGDGKSDLLQIARWEADFLAKMQDEDGGFYFLVYPKERPYEDDVLPDAGDPQVVWPKTTAATAAAVAALAQTASSPLFKQQFPEEAKRYLERAHRGWAFLERAILQHGREGSYQKVSHYGHEFLHHDELAWAAAEMFLATGNPVFERQLISHFDPADSQTRRWTWWRLYEGYGCAIRSYAFAAKTGRLKADQLNAQFLGKCQNEILAAGRDQSRFARECAYGSSFPDPTKRFRSAGWYFSSDRAFDMAVAWQLESGQGDRAAFLEAMVSNMNYEGGCNPVNVVYVTGLGWKRQREIVHQYAQNDRRILPPSGIPLGNIQAGFQFLHHYGKELGTLSFPPDGAEDQPYPFYDRWGDSFNVTTEFVIVNQARALGMLAFLMAQTELKNQKWTAEPPMQIAGLPSELAAGQKIQAGLRGPKLDLKGARIVWEAKDQEPAMGETFEFVPRTPGEHWVEAEVYWPDGRRAFGVADFRVK
jgi:hypothetical protein